MEPTSATPTASTTTASAIRSRRLSVEFVCEFGQADSLDLALAQVEATAAIGATHAKWQVFQPDKLAGPEATRYWHESLGENDSQHDMFADFGCLTESEWREVAKACDDAGVQFMATPFDLEAVDLLESIGVKAYKIASADINYRPLIEKVARTGKRIYLSTGAANQIEISRALKWLYARDVVPMACDLVYPCPPEDSSVAHQLACLRHFCNGWIGRPTLGYSDHTREVNTGAIAVALGATVLEKHVTIDKSRDRPDDRMALDVEQAKQYKQLADKAFAVITRPPGDPQQAARIGARRSAHASNTLPEGHVLTPTDVTWLRPCPAGSLTPDLDVTGMTLNRPVKAGERITQDAVS